MKPFFIALCLFAATLVSCTKEDDNASEISNAELKGTWNCTNYSDFNFNTSSTTDPTTGISVSTSFKYQSIKWIFGETEATYKFIVNITEEYSSPDSSNTTTTNLSSEDIAAYTFQNGELSIQASESLQVYSVKASSSEKIALTFIPEKSDDEYGSTVMVYQLEKE